MSTPRDHRQNNRKSNRFRNNKFSKNKDKNNFNKDHNYQPNQDKRKIFLAQEKLTEAEAGITEYISTAPGFSGIIKARFSDFHVNEIDSAGEIAKLTDVTPPADFNTGKEEEEEDLSKPDIISDEKWEELNKLINDEVSTKVEIDVTGMSKNDRLVIHEGVKRVFGQKIVATTKTLKEKEGDGDNNKKVIEFTRYTKGARQDGFRWPKGKPEYVYFLVYKEAVDTLEATFRISSSVRTKSSLYTYAGVKDKRAKTTQWFCVKKMNPCRLIGRTNYLRNIHIGNFKFKDKPLKLGQLSGNRFRIALRNVTAEAEVINQAMESLNDNGFINYYGLQRFGSDKEVPTFEIGVKLLQGNWKEACNLILKPKLSDDPSSDTTHAKKTYMETSDAEKANKMFNKNYNKCVESKLLLGFIKNHNNDYVNALENIPRNMRLLYIHSFQSLVWNTIVSRRIKEFGLKPIVGDIVLIHETEDANLVDTIDINNINVENENDPGESSSEANQNQEIKILTEEDLNNYTIYDIVLPLPGYDIQYPQNIVKDWYKEILEKYNLTVEMPKQKVKTYTLSGTYRKILGQVKNLSWKILKYNHPNDTLIRSDYEELMGEPEPQDNPNGQFKALIIDFCLSSSSYATMVLRETLKMDTSANVHAKLNLYYDEGKINNPAESSSLLSDAEKYEAFKQQIFGNSNGDGEDVTLKRKIEEDNETMATKKSKSLKDEENASNFSIKVQSSLI